MNDFQKFQERETIRQHYKVLKIEGYWTEVVQAILCKAYDPEQVNKAITGLEYLLNLNSVDYPDSEVADNWIAQARQSHGVA